MCVYVHACVCMGGKCVCVCACASMHMCVCVWEASVCVCCMCVYGRQVGGVPNCLGLCWRS